MATRYCSNLITEQTRGNARIIRIIRQLDTFRFQMCRTAFQGNQKFTASPSR